MYDKPKQKPFALISWGEKEKAYGFYPYPGAMVYGEDELRQVLEFIVAVNKESVSESTHNG